jgi:hypothetical protein
LLGVELGVELGLEVKLGVIEVIEVEGLLSVIH